MNDIYRFGRFIKDFRLDWQDDTHCVWYHSDGVKPDGPTIKKCYREVINNLYMLIITHFFSNTSPNYP